jgi:hypothetical protein
MINILEYMEKTRDERRLHLALDEPCCERGGNSTNHKGVLAQYLNTTIPSGRILLCHACNNGGCSNPRHLYWGTDYDNIIIDGREFGTYKTPFERRVAKYGYEKACAMNSRVGNTFGSGNKGKPKTEEHKRKLSESGKISAKNKPNRKGGRNPVMSFEETYKIYQEFGITKGAEHLGIGRDAFKSRVILAKKKLTLNK